MSVLPFFVPFSSFLVGNVYPLVPTLVADPFTALSYAGLLVMVPHMARMATQVYLDKSYDNVDPRINLQKHLNEPGPVSRLQAAHANGMEGFQFFAAGIVSAALFQSTAGENDMICRVASLHLICRAIYIGLYVVAGVDDRKTEEAKTKKLVLSTARTIVWALGMSCSVYLIGFAGAKYIARNAAKADVSKSAEYMDWAYKGFGAGIGAVSSFVKENLPVGKAPTTAAK